MEHVHARLHRRHARAADPFAEASADAAAAASALAEAFPDPFASPDPTPAPITIVSTVYTTASKTFDGPVGGYSTRTSAVTETPSDSPSTTSTTDKHPPKSSSQADSDSSIVADTTHHTKSKSTDQTTLQTSTGLPSSILPNTSSTLAPSIAIAVASSTPLTSTISATASAASSTSSATPSAGGMSAAGKAGLAIGILLLLGTVLATVLFCFKKRRAAEKAERLDNEKTEMWGGAERTSTRTTTTAPRLSLRPVTQFLPNLGERRSSRGNALAMASTPISAPTEPRNTGSPGGRPMLSPDAHRDNPFGNHAEAIDAVNANGPAVVNSVSPGGEIVAGAAAAGAIGLARGTSKRENALKQIDFTKGGPFRGPPSPAGTDFSMSSDTTPGTATQTPQGAAIAAAGGPTNSAVHRVQLDFSPSMDDELELRAGQLIRVLHEYDDGWALCIRLDRSKQGVVPRTCLSTRPVKPRPQPNSPRGAPPPGMRVPQQGRPMSPAMNQGPPRSMSPAGNRPTTPQGRPMTPQGRPMTPSGPQPQMMTPQNQSRPSSPSAAQMQGRQNSPPGPSPMNQAISFSPQSQSRIPTPANGPVMRKPVGQAL